MSQLLIYSTYFLLGGTIVASIAFLAGRGNYMLAVLVANLPVLFLFNIWLMYRNGGLEASVTYARGALVLLPVFACYAGITIWLLPHLGMPRALLPGLPLYLTPVILLRMIRAGRTRITARTIEAATRAGSESPDQLVSN